MFAVGESLRSPFANTPHSACFAARLRLGGYVFRVPRMRVSVPSVVGNLLTNRPPGDEFMVLQENYDHGVRQTRVVIG